MNIIRKHEGVIVREPQTTRPSATSLALSAVLVIECSLVAWLTILLIIDLVTTPSRLLASSLALLVIAILTIAWIAVTVIGALLGRSWSRSSSVTIQLVVLAVALGSFQGIVLEPLAGFPLLVLTLAGGALALFSVPRGSITRESDQD